MAKDPDAFRALIEPMIMDGYLDVQEEIQCMMRASGFGLAGPEADRILVECCEKHGAVLERLAKQKFKEQVRASVGDKFLDQKETQSLEQIGMHMFERAADANELVSTLLLEVLRAEGATTEKLIRDDMNRRLEALAAQGRFVEPEVWKRLRTSALEQVAKLGVNMEENDIGAILDDCLKSSSLQLRSSRTPMFVGMGAVALTLGIVVLGGLAVLLWPGGQKPAEAGSAPVHLSSSLTCDDTCKAEIKEFSVKLRVAAESNRYVTPADDCVKKWYTALNARCAAYTDLPPAQRSAAAAAEPAWSWCDTDNVDVLRRVVDDYVRWADARDGGKPPCEWLDRCLDALPGNERCAAAAAQHNCAAK